MQPLRILSINPGTLQTVTRALSEDWSHLLFPFDYEGWIGWSPTTVFLTYNAERYLGPLATYLLFSTVFIVTALVLGLAVTGSVLFASTLAFMFAFGTQLNYAYTYGSVIHLYLMLTYAGLNFAIGLLLVGRRVVGLSWRAGFVVSLVVVALSSEWWINYAVSVVTACVFGFFWASHHERFGIRAEALFVGGVTVVVLFCYLIIRLQFAGQFVKPGQEEELLLNYSYLILKLEDFIVNFMTFLYVTLTNYLPSFVSSSNSLTYLGSEIIVREQHGYHESHQHLVVMSHLFLWRFYSGIAVTLFFGVLAYLLMRSWQRPSTRNAIIVALLLMVMTGFSTHLLIKMRPYNTAPALPYKAIVSISFFTVLVAYVASISRSVSAGTLCHPCLPMAVCRDFGVDAPWNASSAPERGGTCRSAGSIHAVADLAW